MHQSLPRSLFAVLLAVFASAALCARAQDEHLLRNFALQHPAERIDQLIVRFKDEPGAGRRGPMAYDRARALSVRAGMQITPLRPMAGGAHVVSLPHAMSLEEAEQVAAIIATDSNVLYAQADRRRYPLRVATDPAFFLQWYLSEPAGGINATRAWDITTGSSSVVVAVIDTGVLPANPDLNGRLASGYSFVSPNNTTDSSNATFSVFGPFATANDGDGRDSDPSDPGDWISASEAGNPPFVECPSATDSTWHGTHVAGLIGAAANNGFGIAGVDWNARLLPVRALGKCGGTISDIVDGMYWAAGFHVNGVPDNPTANLANVINLSLGGPGPCTAPEQQAITDILGTSNVRAIVTSAGNKGDTGEDASQNAPGNCVGVINVGATTRSGSKASYSDSGTAVTISAPGGFISPTDPTDTGVNGILATTNCGKTSPVPSALASTCPDPRDTPQPFVGFFFAGTSSAAPQVSGVISLMLAANRTLSSTDVRNILRTTARAFPDSTCSTTTCGAGIVDAGAAVQRAATLSGGISMPPPMSGGDGGGGGGGGGGCTTGGGAADPGLPLLALLALAGLHRRRTANGSTGR